MKITYSIWQGSLCKSSKMTATKMSEIISVIEDLNSAKPITKFEFFVTQIDQN